MKIGQMIRPARPLYCFDAPAPIVGIRMHRHGFEYAVVNGYGPWQRRIRNGSRQLREKREKMGLKRFDVYLHPSEWPLVKRYIERLAKRRNAK